jgi:hypothetical protein
MILMTVDPFRTARSSKVSFTKNMFASYGDKFEVVQVDDITVDDISEHLDGVDKVIHAAAALPSVADAKIILKVSRLLN